MFGHVLPPRKTTLENDLEILEEFAGLSPAVAVIKASFPTGARNADEAVVAALRRIMAGEAPLEVFLGQRPDALPLYRSFRYHADRSGIRRQPFLAAPQAWSDELVQVRYSPFLGRFIRSPPQSMPYDPVRYVARFAEILSGGRLFPFIGDHPPIQGDFYIPTAPTERGRAVEHADVRLPL